MNYLEIENGTRRIDVTGITHIEAARGYVIIYLRWGKPILIARNLIKVLAQLPTLQRIHRSYAINPRYVTNYTRTNGCGDGEVTLGTTIRLPVSRSYRGLYNQVRPFKRPVVNETTGQYYPSINEASLGIGCRHEYLSTILASTGTIKQNRVRYATDAEIQSRQRCG